MIPTYPSFNEAPAILPGRDETGAALALDAEVASMRPRRFCRGEAARSASVRSRSTCFNEAPAILPGRARPKPARRRSPRRFNEAPAILPGRAPSRRSWAASDGYCFNEAPAILPGRVPDRRRRDPQLVEASMRPRRFCRGELCGKAGLVLPHTPASMRPRRFCRGELSRGPRPQSLGGIASMRPRRFCRGEPDRRRRDSVMFEASMRPRRFCRGESADGGHDVSFLDMLQ